MRLMPMGTTGLLIEVPDLDAVLGLHERLDRSRPPYVRDLVPAERTLLIRYDPEATHSGDVVRWVRGVSSGAGPAPRHLRDDAEEVTLDVRYDGADLAEVAALVGLTEDQVVEAHTGTPWTVAFTGFAPGFGYLVGGDPRLLTVSRRETPRTRVPAGSVALAGGYSGVYPRISPGGWHLLGHTEAVVWDVDRDPPALLRPGVTVRFRAA